MKIMWALCELVSSIIAILALLNNNYQIATYSMTFAIYSNLCKNEKANEATP